MNRLDNALQLRDFWQHFFFFHGRKKVAWRMFMYYHDKAISLKLAQQESR